MSRTATVAACAALLALPAVAGVSPAGAGEWRHHHHHHHHDHALAAIHHGHVHRVPWYHQPPLLGTGPGYYYSHHPDHIPAYPTPRTGYPVPIHPTSRPVVHVVPRYRVTVSAHVEWCVARYRSYDAHTDTFQPYHGPRRYCRSPWR
ncbi:MAG: BA14K family protein [Rhizobiaceae bacterium]|nr:BA14K family protein [Rhizobiaceae bacterium]MCV0405265.1 BA14K family protein [Rhizobiaceae bacterium]